MPERVTMLVSGSVLILVTLIISSGYLKSVFDGRTFNSHRVGIMPIRFSLGLIAACFFAFFAKAELALTPCSLAKRWPRLQTDSNQLPFGFQIISGHQLPAFPVPCKDVLKGSLTNFSTVFSQGPWKVLHAVL